MNLPTFTVPLPPIQEPPPPPRAREDDDRYRTDRADREADDAFDRALKQELERKAGQAPPPPPLPIIPLMMPVPQLTTSSSDAISASAAASALSSVSSRAANLVSSSSADAGQERAVAASAPAERPEEGPATPIRLVVEPGLPPVQPTGDGAQKVSLVDFPQVVVGQVRQLVHHNKPLTQLDFQISPPHVGPVNLQVTYTQGVVGVQLTALTLQAKQALEGQVGTIHQILTAHNLTPGQIRVVTAVGGRAGANGAGARGEQAGFGFFSGGRRRQPGTDDGTVKTT